jgi:hypothetical protein
MRHEQARWYESAVDRKIREAREQGEFDNLPGTGRPLSDHGHEYDEDWWVKDWVRREDSSGALPATLALRREAEDLTEIVDRHTSESSVRAFVDAFNAKVRQAQRGLMDGPATVLPAVDVDEVLRGWRQRRSRRRR